jgi:hypothetical protein
MPVLKSTVTEIAEVDPPRDDKRLVPFRFALMAEGARLVVTRVRRALREPVTVAVPAEILPGLEEARTLGAGETPEEGVIGLGGVVEMTGGTDNLALQLSGFSERKKRGLL